MSVHVRVIAPVVPTGLAVPDDLAGILSLEDQVSYTELDSGPASVESGYDAARAAPDLVAKCIAAERDGAGAIVIDCMADPGLYAARECVSIPVIGPCQMAMALAGTLGHRFSVLSISRRSHASFARRARIYGSAENYASTRSVEIPVAELSARSGVLQNRLFEAALAAIEEDDADTLVVGCTRIFAIDALSKRLAQAGYDVPIIDPIPASVKMAKTLVELGLSHSKHAFARPASLPPEIGVGLTPSAVS